MTMYVKYRSEHRYILIQVPSRGQKFVPQMVRATTVVKWIRKSYEQFCKTENKMDRLMLAALIIQQVQALVDGCCLPPEVNELLLLAKERINGGYNYATNIDALIDELKPVPTKEVMPIE
jgi:hypothetical protein